VCVPVVKIRVYVTGALLLDLYHASRPAITDEADLDQKGTFWVHVRVMCYLAQKEGVEVGHQHAV
jgi:hypothetical protein